MKPDVFLILRQFRRNLTSYDDDDDDDDDTFKIFSHLKIVANAVIYYSKDWRNRGKLM